GTMTIDASGAGDGFAATGGGTVNITGANNHIATVGGTALSINGTAIGASNVTFHDISANGGANGIFLNNTGSSGRLHVTGKGAVIGASGGGVIQNMTGADGTTAGTGIYLNNTHDVQLNGMHLHDFQNFGIRGISVNDFTLSNSTIDATASASAKNGTPRAANGDSVKFGTDDRVTHGLTGTASITNTTIADGFESNFEVFNHTGSL